MGSTLAPTTAQSTHHGPVTTPPTLAWGQASAAALLSELLGEPVTVRHHCPACGSSAHGRPWTRLADGSQPDISSAHAGGLTLVGVTWTGRIGVDLEPATHTPPPGIADLAQWVRAEAYLKATGDGLRRDPATVNPDEPGAVWGTITIDPDHVATWCLVSLGMSAVRAGPATL